MEEEKYKIEEVIGVNQSDQQIESTCPEINLNRVLPQLKDFEFETVEKNRIIELLQGGAESDISEAFRALNEWDPKTFEEVIWLYKCVCAIFLSKGNFFHITTRYNLLKRTFLLSCNDWDINPVHIHKICKSLWEILEDDRQVIYLARKICLISHMGFNVSVCLVWASVFRQLNQEIKMFRFHKFHKLVEMLQKVSINSLKNDTNFTYNMLQSISFLQNVILRKPEGKKGEEMVQTPFVDYFNYEQEHLVDFREWCIFIKSSFEVQPQTEKNIADNALIYELIEFDILHSLQELFQQEESLL